MSVLKENIELLERIVSTPGAYTARKVGRHDAFEVNYDHALQGGQYEALLGAIPALLEHLFVLQSMSPSRDHEAARDLATAHVRECMGAKR